MVDERGVEAALPFERAANQPPDEPPQPPFERPIHGRRAIGQDVPVLVDRLDLPVVVGRRRIGQRRHPLERVIERRERVVVLAIGVGPLALEALQQLFQSLVVQGQDA